MKNIGMKIGGMESSGIRHGGARRIVRASGVGQARGRSTRRAADEPKRGGGTVAEAAPLRPDGAKTGGRAGQDPTPATRSARRQRDQEKEEGTRGREERKEAWGDAESAVRCGAVRCVAGGTVGVAITIRAMISPVRESRHHHHRACVCET
jgi:hypothetical protein